MDIYFYCTYTNSRKGFTLTKLQQEKLVPIKFDDVPDQVSNFFSYDLFRILWAENTRRGSDRFHKEITSGFFGIRDLCGRVQGDRTARINMAIEAAADEITELNSIARKILSDCQGFQGFLLRLFSIGGPNGYQMDGTELENWLQTAKQENTAHAEPFSCFGFMDDVILHLGVCTGPWKDACQAIGLRSCRLRRPKNLLDSSESAYF